VNKKWCIFAAILNSKINMLNFLKLKEMKKVFLFCVIAMAFASCAPKAAETTPAVDSTKVVVDSTKVVADSAAVVDTTKAVK